MNAWTLWERLHAAVRCIHGPSRCCHVVTPGSMYMLCIYTYLELHGAFGRAWELYRVPGLQGQGCGSGTCMQGRSLNDFYKVVSNLNGRLSYGSLCNLPRFRSGNLWKFPCRILMWDVSLSSPVWSQPLLRLGGLVISALKQN